MLDICIRRKATEACCVSRGDRGESRSERNGVDKVRIEDRSILRSWRRFENSMPSLQMVHPTITTWRVPEPYVCCAGSAAHVRLRISCILNSTAFHIIHYLNRCRLTAPAAAPRIHRLQHTGFRRWVAVARVGELPGADRCDSLRLIPGTPIPLVSTDLFLSS